MSFYPILKAPGTRGWVTLCNFSPNNWEAPRNSDQLINVTWSSGSEWLTESLGVLAMDAVRTVTAQELASRVPEDALPLLSITRTLPPPRSDALPKLDALQTTVPAWRATLGLTTEDAETSYQGELDPFDPKSTLLTFGPFLQFGTSIENHLILLNIENSPLSRSSELEIYDADGLTLRGKFDVRSNEANLIPLDGLGFGPGDFGYLKQRSGG